MPTAHRLVHGSPRPGAPPAFSLRPGISRRRRTCRSPGEGTEPTAHRLTCESPCRPGHPTRRPPHFPYGPAFQEGTEPADRPVRVPGLYGRPFGLHPGVPPQTPPHLSASEVGRFLRKRRCDTDRPDILLLLKQRPHHGDRSWPGSWVVGRGSTVTGQLPHLNPRPEPRPIPGVVDDLELLAVHPSQSLLAFQP